MDLTRETDIAYSCTRLLEAVGARVYRLSQGRRTRQSAGLPDLYVLDSRLGGLWIECKQPKGVQSAAQRQFAARCMAAHVPYLLVRTVAGLQEYLRLQKLVG